MRNEKKTSSEMKESNFDLKKAERNRELKKRIIIGDILLSLHRNQGTEGYLIAAIAPYLKKGDRTLFGLI